MENWEDEASACVVESDTEMEAGKQADMDTNSDSEIQAIITTFGEMVLKQTVSENNALRKIVTHNSNTCSQILEQKMMLLCGMSQPIANRLAMVAEIGNMQKQVLEQFQQLYSAEEKHLTAYAAHCDKAILETKAQEEIVAYDEYTNMPYVTLCEHKLDMERQYKALRQACVEETAKQKTNIMNYESEYNTLLKEIELFDNYKLEALGVLDELNFELKKVQNLRNN